MGRRPAKEPARTKQATKGPDGKLRKKTTIYLDIELARRLAHFAIDVDRDMSRIISAAIEEYLAKHG